MTDRRSGQGHDLGKSMGELRQRYDDFRARGLSLDMTRGKPCGAQLDLSAGLLDCLEPGEHHAADGTDCRNYGGLDGLPEAKKLFTDYLEVGQDEIIVGGNSSLAFMHDIIVQALLCGVPDGDGPWRAAAVKFLCPSPGYDRHFAICERFGIEMIVVGMNSDGPDIDHVEELAAGDRSIKGIWCVPKYSNPTGVTFSDSVVERLAVMKTAAADFRIFWDNAYSAHHLTDEPDHLLNLLAACKKAGAPNRALIIGSTSKVSFAGAGLAMVGGSAANLAWLRSGLSTQTIGPDKLNQLRHVRFFRDMAGIVAHMRKHAEILRPKFDAVQDVLERELGGTGVATWSHPRGGYFVSLDTRHGCATKVVALAAAAGVKLTAAGATFPLGKDPHDCNIRIAPSLPSLEEIRTAMELLTICIQLVASGAGKQ